MNYRQTDPQYKLRLPQELKEKLVEYAGKHGRSLNAEIVLRLERTIGVDDHFDQRGVDLVATESEVRRRQEDFDRGRKRGIDDLKATIEQTIRQAIADALGKPAPSGPSEHSKNSK